MLYLMYVAGNASQRLVRCPNLEEQELFRTGAAKGMHETQETCRDNSLCCAAGVMAVVRPEASPKPFATSGHARGMA